MLDFAKIPALLIALIAQGCVTGPAAHKANSSRIRSYTFELENQKHLEAPYVAKFENNGKLLLYIASKHISKEKFPNLLDHPTLRTIANVFADFKPEVVVVEGLDTGSELSPKSIVSKADECEKSNYRACGESFFAINQARKVGAAYITGEPKNIQIKEQILGEGYTAEDLLGFYLVRQIPQLKRQAEFDRSKFPEQADKQLVRFQQQIATKLNFRFVEFERWYAQNMTNPKNVLDITNNDAAPHGGPDATYVQKISNKVCLIRDRSVLSTIDNMFETYSRVLVVYGGSHLITQEPAIESTFGKPTYFRSDSNVPK